MIQFVDAEETFSDLPPTTAKVEFVWLANELQTRLTHVLVVCRDNERLLWDYEIEPASGAGVAEIVPFPVVPGGDDFFDDDMVKPKTIPAKKSEQE